MATPVTPQPLTVRAARQEWMDVVRGTAVLLIVLFHSGTLMRYADERAPAAALAVNAAVGPFRIPLLVLLSGMLLPASMRKGPRRYVVGKLRAVAWPFLVWTAVYAVLTWPSGPGVAGWYLPLVLSGGSYLWFLLFLLVFYLAALAVKFVPRLPLVAALLVLSEALPDDTKYAERPTYLLALFLLGWWIAERPALLRTLTTSRWVLAGALVLTVPAVLLLPASGYGPRSTLVTLAGAAVIAGVATRCAGFGFLRPLKFVGKNSIVLYVVHFPVVYVIAHVAGLVGGTSPALLFAGSFTVAVAAGVLVARGRGRWKPVEWLFTAPRRQRWTGPVTETRLELPGVDRLTGRAPSM